MKQTEVVLRKGCAYLKRGDAIQDSDYVRVVGNRGIAQWVQYKRAAEEYGCMRPAIARSFDDRLNYTFAPVEIVDRRVRCKGWIACRPIPMVREFQVGDRVKCYVEDELSDAITRPKVGDLGTVVQPADERFGRVLVGVAWDNQHPIRHSCNGQAMAGHGWCVPAATLRLVLVAKEKVSVVESTDEKMRRLNTKYMGEGFASMTSSEAIDFINALKEIAGDRKQSLDRAENDKTALREENTLVRTDRVRLRIERDDARKKLDDIRCLVA
jgi:hypothetical protein